MPNQYWIDHIKWSVYWRRNRKYVRKRFHDDLPAAILYFLKKRETNPEATLHSDNAAFPPPKRLTEHERVKWEIVEAKGKKFKRKVTTHVNLLKAYNDRGVWWCPYCIALRRFKDAITTRGVEMYCPVCHATNYDFNVRRYNPKAVIIEQHKRQPPRRTRGRSRRRKR